MAGKVKPDAEKKAKDITGEMKDAARRIWLAGLGALAAAEEEGSKVFKTLVDRGEDFEKRQRPRVDRTMKSARGKVKKVWSKVGSNFDERVAAVLQRLGVPDREAIDKLSERVERLSVNLEKLQTRKAPARKPATTARKKKVSS